MPVTAAEKVAVNIYVYHLKPPFIVDLAKKEGLYFDFSTFLNKKSLRFHFETVFVPRKRAEYMLKHQQLDGALLGVNPVWFNDKAETKYLWTDKILTDEDEVVSLIKNKIVYLGADSLIGLTLGGVLGFYYYGIDELVTEGKITRQNTIGEKELLLMLQYGRVDVGIISRSTLRYIFSQEPWQALYYISPRPHDTYDRRILIPHNNQMLFNLLAPIIAQLDTDEDWQELLKKYQLHDNSLALQPVFK